MLRGCLTLVVSFCLAGFATAAPPPGTSPNPKALTISPEELSKATQLVQKLGSEEFTAREAAHRELATMGRLARPALLDGVSRNPDAEIRKRCRLLLPKATAAEMKARLDAFVADTAAKYEHDLPGWHKLRAVVRGEWEMFGWTLAARPAADKAARTLYIEMMKAPGGREMLAALDGSPTALGRMVAGRKQDLYNMRFSRRGGPSRNVSAAEVLVAIFAESQVDSSLVPRATALTTVLQTSGLLTQVRGTTERAQAVQAVMTAWFDSRTDPVELYSALSLANGMTNNDVAGRLAGRLMISGGQGYYKGSALTTLVRLKRVDQLPAIEKAFTDMTVLTTVARFVNGKQVRQSIEVRDAALAAALLLAGQEPQDYGFAAFPKNIGANFSYIWAKIDDEKRAAAFVKYGWWQLKESLILLR